MNKGTESHYSFKLTPEDNERLLALCGPAEAHLALIEKSLAITINHRGNKFTLNGIDDAALEKAKTVIQQLYALSAHEKSITQEKVHLALRSHTDAEHHDKPIILRTKKGKITARTPNQKSYLQAIFHHTIAFGIGPAGTGKTFLAVACAVDALEKNLVQRLILVRPAVEAGERLGFLPGDLTQKVDPYLRPIYDALYELLGFETVHRLLSHNIIEIAPLAYMRGRTLNDAFIILDEAQNTTVEQMKMFLTRIGFNSKAVITGDTTQVDLAKNQPSGLNHVRSLLRNIEYISFTEFTSKDVVRHPVIQSIIEAYEKDNTFRNH